MTYLLAQDIGTSSAKAALFTSDGVLVRSCSTFYEVQRPAPNWAQQNAEVWWDAFCENNHKLLDGLDISCLAAISVSGQMMGCLPIDTTGSPLYPSIIWEDGRALEQAKKIEKIYGEDAFYLITGMHISENYALPKIMWLKETQPDIYRRTACFLQSKDYIVYRMTGKMVTEATDAQYYHCFDILKNQWSADLLNAVEIGIDKFPKLVKSGTIVGHVQPSIARECGLPSGLPVVEGLGDGRAALVGTGVLSIGDAYISLGTSSWMSFITSSEDLDPHSGDEKIVFLQPGVFVGGGTMNAGGYSLQWMKERLCEPEAIRSSKCGTSVYDEISSLVNTCAPGSGGVIFLPYLLGEREPYFDSRMRGAFLGLSASTTRAQMCRSVMEGVAMHLNLFKRLAEKNDTLHTMRIVGGGAKNAVWRQIIADIFEMPILETNISDEAGSVGVAVMAGMGIGLYHDIQAVNQFQKIVSITQPREEFFPIYRKLQLLFESSYDVLKETSHALADLQS